MFFFQCWTGSNPMMLSAYGFFMFELHLCAGHSSVFARLLGSVS